MRPSLRGSDDADVIRARLRLLLDERDGPGGWLPDDDVDDDEHDRDAGIPGVPFGSPPASRSTGPLVGPFPPVPDGLPQGIGRHRRPGAAVRLDPGRRGVWTLWLAGAVAAVLVVAWTWWQRPQVQPVPASATASMSGGSVSRGTGRAAVPMPTRATGSSATTATMLVASVVGRVHRPGLVTLASGARVADAIAAAGGLLPGADAASVNLAAVVTDGQQIAVGVPGSSGDTGGQTTSTGAGAGAPVDLNRATAADFDGLPGIGPVLAQRIVDYRQQQGAFTSVDQLDDVPGIGPALFAELRKRVTV